MSKYIMAIETNSGNHITNGVVYEMYKEYKCEYDNMFYTFRVDNGDIINVLTKRFIKLPKSTVIDAIYGINTAITNEE